MATVRANSGGDRIEARFVERSTDGPARPLASVIVVTYGRDAEELRQTLDGLASQSASSFEVILVDNGTGWDLRATQADYDEITGYVEFEENYGVNVGRNTAASIASGRVLVFLDDDAVPTNDFVEQHVRAHDRYDIVAARGRVRPKTSSLYNWMGPRYDLGDESFPHPLDLEGNLSIRRDVFEEVSGFDEDVFGHEGIHLTAKILDRYDLESTIYYPEAVVYHDYVDGFLGLVEKKARNDHHRRLLRQRRPALFDVYQRYGVEVTAVDEAPLPVKVLLFAVGRLSDLLTPVVRYTSSYDRPTRTSIRRGG